MGRYSGGDALLAMGVVVQLTGGHNGKLLLRAQILYRIITASSNQLVDPLDGQSKYLKTFVNVNQLCLVPPSFRRATIQEGTRMNEPGTVVRAVPLATAAGVLAIAASALRKKRLTVSATTQQIEDTLAALDPTTRVTVLARLTAEAGRQVKDRIQP